MAERKALFEERGEVEAKKLPGPLGNFVDVREGQSA